MWIDPLVTCIGLFKPLAEPLSTGSLPRRCWPSAPAECSLEPWWLEMLACRLSHMWLWWAERDSQPVFIILGLRLPENTLAVCKQDEVHERDGLTDFLLTKLRDVLQKFPSLKLILSSAALDADLFRQYFGSCPVIHRKSCSFYLLLRPSGQIETPAACADWMIHLSGSFKLLRGCYVHNIFNFIFNLTQTNFPNHRPQIVLEYMLICPKEDCMPSPPKRIFMRTASWGLLIIVSNTSFNLPGMTGQC